MRYRFTPVKGDPATAEGRSLSMKPDIHPQYHVTTVTCTCGNTFTTRSTASGGKQKILDTGGRVARFEKRFGKTSGQQATKK
jgi:large subunit ribosomal protein L31